MLCGFPIPLLQLFFSFKKRDWGWGGCQKDSLEQFWKLARRHWNSQPLSSDLSSPLPATLLAALLDCLALVFISLLLELFLQQGGSVESILSQSVKISNDREGILFISSLVFYLGGSLQDSRQKRRLNTISKAHITEGLKKK